MRQGNAAEPTRRWPMKIRQKSNMTGPCCQTVSEQSEAHTPRLVGDVFESVPTSTLYKYDRRLERRHEADGM